MAPDGKTRTVCVDADVVIAGLFSRSGASHAILVLGEIGLLRIVVPPIVVEEVRRNLADKLAEALPSFERLLDSLAVETAPRPKAAHRKRATGLAHEKDVDVMAAAIAAGATLLVTHNTRHFRSGEGVRVVRPRDLIEEARAWMTGFGQA